ncbi:phage tail tape measure protein [Gallibacterium anatis]|uniref:phage tail tape measure protein n=1 Tax=Gallibacterium anatis TaxID=750 RepID=UPI000B9FE780|nr:phage tail tape measure protein [Gallibacterium anatis]OZN48616.1 phage tail tape measure protein [Gallibacterium anatis]
MKNLELKVILNAVDKITSPLRGVQKQLDKLQGKVKGATDELNKLKQQEKTANSFKRLSDELQQNNHKLVKAKAAAKQLEQQLKNTVNPTAKLKKQVSDAYKQANKMAQAQEQQRKKLNQLRQSLRQGGFDTAKFKTSQQKLKEKIDQSTAAINKQNAAMKKLQQRQAQNKLYNNRVETLKNQSAFMASFGQRAVMHGLATVGTGGMLLKPAMNFEQEFSKVQALTGLNKANPEQAKQLERLRQQNIHLGATTSFTSDEVAQGQGYLAMAGFNAKQIEASMPAILNMTKAAGIEMGQVSDIASDISSGFKISANEMNRVADVLTATFTGSNTTLEGLGETMKYLGPIASATGQDFETMSAMVGLLGNVGIKGSQAGTSLRSAMLRLAGPPKQARKALNALGVSAKDSQGNMRALTDILVDVEKKTAKMGSGKKMEYYKAIFGAEAATAMVELVGQAGVNGIQEMTDKLKQSAGRAEQVAKVMSDNFWGDLKTLSSAKDALSISVFEVTSETLRDAAQKFTELLRKANEWVKANPKLVQAIVKWGAGIGIVLAAMGVLSLVISYTLFPFARLLLMINKYTGISKLFNFALVGTSKNLLKVNKNLFSYKGTVSGLGRITAFAKQKLLSFGATLFSVIPKMKRLSFWVNLLKTTFRVAFSSIRMIAMGIGSAISFLLSPIGLLVAALVGAGVVIYRNWEKVRAFFGGFLEGLKSGLAPVLERFKPLGELFGIVVGWIKKAVKWFTALLTPVKSTSADLDSAAAAGKKFGEWLAAGIDLVTKPLQWLMDSIKWVIDNMPGIETQEKAMSKAMTQNNTAGQLFMAGSGIEDVPAVNKWSGGYAGNGGKYQPKGIFHGGEYIMTKEATSRLGVPLLNALNYGKNAMLAAGLGVSVASAQPIKVDNRPPLSAKSQTSQMASQPMQVTININAQQGQSAVDIAKEVEKALRNLESQKQARARSALRDRD